MHCAVVTASTRALAPEVFLQLAGHPLRWQLLGELARSDRTVHELTVRSQQPQNLVSYHLGKLRNAGLVRSRRSSADRRDTYYTADLVQVGAMLTATGAALHPGLRLTLPPRSAGSNARARVLFLCTGNSSRSQMAEALARARSGGAVEAHSAGSHPKPLHPAAVRVMHDLYGIDLSGQQPKHLDVYATQHFDRVVTLCDRVREVCPELPGAPEPVHWSIPDPAASGADDDAGHDGFRRAAEEIETRVGFLLAALAVSSPDR